MLEVCFTMAEEVVEVAAQPRALKRPPKARSTVWKYFGFVSGKDGSIADDKHVVCTLCQAKVGYSGNTSNLTNHLSNRHKDIRMASDSASLTQSTIKIDKGGFAPLEQVQKLAPSNPRATAITAALANFIAEDLRPISVVEGSGFRKLLALLEPRYQVPCHKTITKVLHKQRDELKEEIKKDLEVVSCVSTTTDLWTSFAGDNYCGLTAHYITPGWEMGASVLSCHKLEGARTALALANFLSDQAMQWGIQEKIVGMTSDNGANIVNAVTDHLNWPHFGCAGHTLQLCLKPAMELPPVDTLLSRAKKIVTHVHKSYKAQEELTTKQKQLGLKTHALVQSVDTRWNSSFDMLQRLNEQVIAVSAVLMGSSKQKHRDMVLTSGEQKKSEELCTVLQPLADATKILSGHQYPSLSFLQPIVTGLLDVHLRESTKDSLLVHEVKETIRTELERRYSDEEARKKSILASLVDPRFKALHGFKPVETALAKESLRKRVESILRRDIISSHVSGTTPVASSAYPPPQKVAKTALSRFFGPCTAVVATVAAAATAESALTDVHSEASRKVEKYLGEKAIAIGEDPLSWWKARESIHPEVAQVAREMLCITATSVPSECLFSDAGNIVTKKRCALSPENAECLIFLYGNLKHRK